MKQYSWDVKYCKGLGTSTAKEAKGYFQNLSSHLVDFLWKNDTSNDEAPDATEFC